MDLQVGDSVVHPIHGVGHIVHVGKKQFIGTETRLYYQVVTDNTTLWIPAESFDKIGMRQLPTKRDLARYRELLKTAPVSFNTNHSKRRIELAERIKLGSFQSLCEIVRDLAAHGWIKPLTNADATSFNRAHARLSREWAAADNISVEQAGNEIDALLSHAKKAFMR